MIRVTQSVISDPLAGLEAFIDQFEEVAFSEFQDVVSEVEPQLMADLRVSVPSVKYPIQWTSEKQRRAFFATDGFGAGIPTQRTGKLQAGWRVDTAKTDGAFFMLVSNPSEKAKFVVGSLAQDRNSALRFMQRFHVNTGWQPAHDTVYFWLDAVNEEYAKRMENIATTESARQAFTKGTRRNT